MTYAFFHLAALFVPGWLLTQRMPLGAERPLLVVALSYTYYTLIAAATMYGGWGLATFYSVYALGVFFLIAYLLLRRRSIVFPQRSALTVLYYIGALAVVGAYLLYRVTVGAYTELPADLFNHLGYVQQHVDSLEAGRLGSELSVVQLLHQSGGIWYGLFAVLNSFAGSQVADTYTVAMAINVSLFLLAVYVFAWNLFGVFELDDTQRVIASVLAAGFTFAHMGINVFAFVRYYSFAPAMLNFILYFAVIVLVMQALDQRVYDTKKLVCGGLITIAAAMIHNQEALFIIVMGQFAAVDHCLQALLMATQPLRSAAGNTFKPPGASCLGVIVRSNCYCRNYHYRVSDTITACRFLRQSITALTARAGAESDIVFESGIPVHSGTDNLGSADLLPVCLALALVVSITLFTGWDADTIAYGI